MNSKIKPIRVLLYGYIDTNVIDGSAFFLPAIANMMTNIPNVEVDLLLSRPIKRLTVLKEVLGNPSVKVIDPFDDSYSGKEVLSFLSKEYITPEQAAEMLVYQETNADYDAKLIRSTEVAYALSRLSEQSVRNLMLYVTDVVNPKVPPSDKTLDSIRRLAQLNAKFITQTSEMSDYLTEDLLGGELGSGSVLPLYPMVPNVESSFGRIFQKKNAYNSFVYTGKFVRDWNPAEIISGFNEVQSQHSEMSLDIAGDQFREDEHNPFFVEEVKHLLNSNDHVRWHGGVDREKARQLIANSDIGIGWRHERLDDSLELSTKLLEYGTLGKPCIMNRTPMHERLFGVDYPLFANSMTEYTALLERIVSQPEIVSTAAETAFVVSLQFTYNEAARRFLPFLLNAISDDFANSELPDSEGREIISMMDYSPDEFLRMADSINATSVERVVGPFVYLHKDISGESLGMSSPVVSGVLEFYVEWRASLKTLELSVRNPTVSEPVPDEWARTDIPGTERLVADLARSNSELKSLRDTVLKMNYHVSTVETKLKNTESRLMALRKSRLGKIQVALWSRK